MRLCRSRTSVRAGGSFLDERRRLNVLSGARHGCDDLKVLLEEVKAEALLSMQGCGRVRTLQDTLSCVRAETEPVLWQRWLMKLV